VSSRLRMRRGYWTKIMSKFRPSKGEGSEGSVPSQRMINTCTKQ
jgi:hypothetical protein